MNFDYVASGHYARIVHPSSDDNGPSVLKLSNDLVIHIISDYIFTFCFCTRILSDSNSFYLSLIIFTYCDCVPGSQSLALESYVNHHASHL